MPLRFRVHSVTCAIGCADASIPTREGQRRLSRRVIAGATANEHDRRPASMTPPRSTPLATPVDLRRQRNTSDRELASRLHPGYRDAIGRLPAGRRGLPRAAVPIRPRDDRAPLAPARPRGGRRPAARRARPVMSWSPISATPGGTRSRGVRPTCRSAGSRPSASRWPATPWSWPRDGTIAGVMRRRFEVNEGIIGWGQGAFAAVAHTIDTPLDWRGPYPAMPVGWLRRAGARRPARDPARQPGVPPRPGWPIRCPVRPATSRCGSTRSRSRMAPGMSSDCGWNRSRRSMRAAASSSRRSRRSVGPPHRWSSSRGARSGSTAQAEPGRSGVDLGQVFRAAPGAAAARGGRRAVARGRRMGDAARGSAARRPRRSSTSR